ncbi:hypothetical protein RhiJN_03723 [Ceratobasidium sp. AG-Ba]|nr:hypothetical protein RhiJN_03723 [Ceratobasidium sp. AG-Ba]QRW04618.1 hypothetical protein RhiLY_03617 [Ceratobasidium sp. AG-Ba]
MSSQASYQTDTASQVCMNQSKFLEWALRASCGPLPDRKITKPDLDALPPQVREMLQESLRFPKWLKNPQSENYLQFQSIYPDLMDEFITGDPSLFIDDEAPDDQVISRELRNETDLRHPIDRLINHVWCTEAGLKNGFLSRMECTLKLPKYASIQKCIADSVAFFYNTSRPKIMFTQPISMGLACTPGIPEYLEFVHWVTEFKGNNLDVVCRQVCYGMVSSLWQRRALGRMEDLVFGTAHSLDTLVVYVARWIKEAKVPPKETAGEAEVVAVAEAAPPPPIKNKPGSKKKTKEDPGSSKVPTPGEPIGTGKAQSHSQSFPAEDSDDTPSTVPSGVTNNSEGEYMIKIQLVGTYSTRDPVAMTQYYLLMRASRKVATECCESLGQHHALLKTVQELEQWDWSHPLYTPKPRSTSQPSGLDGVPEEPVADPKQEAEWKSEWEKELETALSQCGPGPVPSFASIKSEVEVNFDDRICLYLGAVSHEGSLASQPFGD